METLTNHPIIVGEPLLLRSFAVEPESPLVQESSMRPQRPTESLWGNVKGRHLELEEKKTLNSLDGVDFVNAATELVEADPSLIESVGEQYVSRMFSVTRKALLRKFKIPRDTEQEEQQLFDQELDQLLGKNVTPRLFAGAALSIHNLYTLNPEGTSNEAEHMYVRIIQSLGLTETQAVESMKSIKTRVVPNNPAETRLVQGKLLGSTVSVLANLSSVSTEAPGVLAKYYGIRNFFRYLPKHLISQIDIDAPELQEKQLVVTSWSDHNGALNKPSIFEDNQGVMKTIYAEAGSMTDLARVLLVSSGTGGVSRTPLQRIVINGHGTKNSIDLGDGIKGDEQSLVTSEQLNKSAALPALRQRGIINTSTDIILASCSTGARGGLAQLVHEKTSQTVVAAGKSATLTIGNRGGARKLLLEDADGPLPIRNHRQYRRPNAHRAESVTIVYDNKRGRAKLRNGYNLSRR